MDQERLDLPSASSWRRYELCAGSFQLEQEARRLGQEAHVAPTAASARGDHIHSALADEEVALTETEAVTAEFLRERADDQVKRIFGDEPVTELKEQRLWFKLDGHLAASGRFDRVVYTDKLALVQDFKTGWAEPDPAETNAQLKFLSVLVAMHLRQVTEVVAQVVSGPYGVTETRFSLGELAHAYNDIVGTLRKLRDPQAAFAPSPEACRYCPAINICPAAEAMRQSLTQIQWMALPDCNEAAAKLLETVEIVANHLEGIRAYYHNRMEENPNYQIPGWGLVQGPPKRMVTDWHTARMRLEEYVDAAELNGAESYRLINVEKMLGKKLKLKGSELKAKLAEILSGLIEEKYSAKSLKRLKGEPKVTALMES